MARPSKYTEALANKICAELAKRHIDGNSEEWEKEITDLLIYGQCAIEWEGEKIYSKPVTELINNQCESNGR